MPIRVTHHSLHGGSDPHYVYAPKDDITASQLARVLPILITSWKDENGHSVLDPGPIKAWLTPHVEALPEETKRHFELRGA